MGATPGRERGGFFEFFRGYAQTGIHAASASGLTLFGLLTFVHRGFVVLAIAVYVLPPVYLYLTSNTADREGETSASGDRGVDVDDTTVPTDTGEHTGSDTATGSERAETDTGDIETDTETAADADTGGSGDGTDTDTGDLEPSIEATETEPNVDTAGPDAADTDGTDATWTTIESPTDRDLYDVVESRDGPYAVGDDGHVLARRAGAWEPVLERGPTVQSNPLWGAAVSSDGRTVWFAGDSGVFARYDVEDEELTDHSAPAGITDTWEDVAVVGQTGEETLYLVNGSGQVLRGERGASPTSRSDGGPIDWDGPVKPGSGSSLSSIEFVDDSTGYCCDTNSGVFETRDGGDGWTAIGIEDEGADFTDVAPVDPGAIEVSCDDGSVLRYDGTTWTKRHVSGDVLTAIERDDERGLACDDGGTIYERATGGWHPTGTPAGDGLCGIGIGAYGPDVAVGEDGAIVERDG